MQINPYASPNHALERPIVPMEPTTLLRFEGEVVDSIDAAMQRRFCSQATRRFFLNWRLLVVIGLSIILLIWFLGKRESIFASLALLGTLCWLGLLLLFHQWRLKASLSEIDRQGNFPVRGELFTEGFLLQGSGWEQYGTYQLISGIWVEPNGSICNFPMPATRGAFGFRLLNAEPPSTTKAFGEMLVTLSTQAARTPLTRRLLAATSPPLLPLGPIRFQSNTTFRLRDHKGISPQEWRWNRWSWISAMMFRIHLVALFIGIAQIVTQMDGLILVVFPLLTFILLFRERRGWGLVFGFNPIVSDLQVAIGEEGYCIHSNAVRTHILWRSLLDVDVEEGILMGRLENGGIRTPLLRAKWFDDPSQWAAVVQLAKCEIPPIRTGS